MLQRFKAPICRLIGQSMPFSIFLTQVGRSWSSDLPPLSLLPCLLRALSLQAIFRPHLALASLTHTALGTVSEGHLFLSNLAILATHMGAVLLFCWVAVAVAFPPRTPDRQLTSASILIHFQIPVDWHTSRSASIDISLELVFHMPRPVFRAPSHDSELKRKKR